MVNNADYARNMTKADYMKDNTRPLFDYFAPKGQTAEQALREADEKLAAKKRERALRSSISALEKKTNLFSKLDAVHNEKRDPLRKRQNALVPELFQGIPSEVIDA